MKPYTQRYWVDQTEAGLDQQLDELYVGSKEPQVTVYRLAEIRAAAVGGIELEDLAEN